MSTRWSKADLDAHLSKRGKAKTPKYGNRKKTINRIEFDSVREADRYAVLLELAHAGIIQDLKLQYVFAIIIDGVRICDYIADFVYQQDGCKVVEDAKGMKTEVYRLKKKLMKAVHGVEIFET